MQYEFLKQFSKRMKHVGMYALLLQNSLAKQTWKQYGFMKTDEQINMIFAVMLYIMEQSLREESCTMDDIGAYIDNLNTNYFQKNMSYDDCKKLGDFIVNIVLSNEGRAMYFDGFDFEDRAYKIMNVSYIANRIIYVDEGIKRTSYYLTEDGYNLMLSTLEIENNMKLTIHEMIFKLHLEKQSYDKAVDEIKNVFNFMRIQLQKIEEAMLRVRRNALSYSVADYESLMLENMATIGDTKEKFMGYREMVKQRALELEQQNINVRKLNAEEDTDELLDFDEEQWQEELERKKKEKLKRYEDSLAFIIDAALKKGSLTLVELKDLLQQDEQAQKVCIPTIDVFKEIMVELIKNREISMDVLRKEKSEYITEQANDFQLNDMLLGLTEDSASRRKIKRIFVERLGDGAVVEFEHVRDELGSEKTIRCTNVIITLELVE